MPHPRSQTVIVAPRFCGPPGTGNGGYVAGALAELLGDPERDCEEGDQPVTVSLRQPAPLGAPMLVEQTPEDLRLTFGGAVIAEGARTSAEIDPVGPVTPEEAAAAAEGFAGWERHVFPGCFVCGTDRADGLRIFPGPVDPEDGHSRVAALWTPSPDVAQDADGEEDGVRRTGEAVTWAALDCIGGWAIGFEDRVMVLGRMTATLDDLPVVGEPHVVVAQDLGSRGRKSYSAATLYDADDRIVARAEHLWVSVDKDEFLARADRR